MPTSPREDGERAASPAISRRLRSDSGAALLSSPPRAASATAARSWSLTVNGGIRSRKGTSNYHGGPP